MPAVLPAVTAILALGACLPPGPGPSRTESAWESPVEPPTTVLRAFAPPPASTPWVPGHRGVDLATGPDGPIRADGAGVVAFAGLVAGSGVVVVDHGAGLRSTFQPVVASVPAGTRVAAGDLLGRLGVWWRDAARGGLAGLGGHCAGQPCLHWGMLRDGAYVDPLVVTGIAAGCRSVRLLPVDGSVPMALHPTGAVPAVGAGTGPGAPADPDSHRALAVVPPGDGPGPGGTAALVAQASVVAAGAAVPALVALRRRRAPRSRAGPP